MSEPNGYLIHGTAFSSKEAAFKALVSNHDQESWFQKIWDEDAQPYYFEPQPQLTIPERVADWLDKAFEEYSGEGRMASTILTMHIIRNISKSKDIEEWFTNYNIERLNLALAYLAGKALGVDLVKVVEE